MVVGIDPEYGLRVLHHQNEYVDQSACLNKILSCEILRPENVGCEKSADIVDVHFVVVLMVYNFLEEVKQESKHVFVQIRHFLDQVFDRGETIRFL